MNINMRVYKYIYSHNIYICIYIFPYVFLVLCRNGAATLFVQQRAAKDRRPELPTSNQGAALKQTEVAMSTWSCHTHYTGLLH